MSNKLQIQKNLIAIEDLLVGIGAIVQNRGGTDVTVNKINAANLPYDDEQTLGEFADALTATVETISTNANLLIDSAEFMVLAQSLQDNIAELTAWLSTGTNIDTLTPYKPFGQVLSGTNNLAGDINWVSVGDLEVEEGASVTVGAGANLFNLTNSLTNIPVKLPVRCATTANITLSGEQTIDGIAVVAGDRVLVKNQSTASQNGIYEAKVGAWIRAADCTTTSTLVKGSQVLVTDGSTNSIKLFYCATANPIIIGTTNLTFTAVP
jgi:uncharacterized cupin superfamily protein